MKARELASVLRADIETACRGEVVTPRLLHAALLASLATLTPPRDEVIVETDAGDPNCLNVSMPADWINQR